MSARRFWLLPLVILLLVPVAGCRSGAPDAASDGEERSGAGKEEKKARKPFRQVLPTVAFEMMHDSPTMSVLDVRTVSERNSEGYINNSNSYPLESLKLDVSSLEILKGRTFLVFDSGAQNDDRARQAVLLLRSAGWHEAVLLEGGLASWRRFGFGVVGGTVD